MRFRSRWCWARLHCFKRMVMGRAQGLCPRQEREEAGARELYPGRQPWVCPRAWGPFLGDMALLSLALRHLLPYMVRLHSGFWGRVLSPSLLGFLGKAQFCHVLRGKMQGRDRRLKTGKAPVLRALEASAGREGGQLTHSSCLIRSLPYTCRFHLLY